MSEPSQEPSNEIKQEAISNEEAQINSNTMTGEQVINSQSVETEASDFDLSQQATFVSTSKQTQITIKPEEKSAGESQDQCESFIISEQVAEDLPAKIDPSEIVSVTVQETDEQNEMPTIVTKVETTPKPNSDPYATFAQSSSESSAESSSSEQEDAATSTATQSDSEVEGIEIVDDETNPFQTENSRK